MAEQPDKVVLWVAGALRRFQRLVNIPLYGWQEEWFARRFNRGNLSPYFNYVYFVEWAAIVSGLAIAASNTTGVAQLVVVAVALWRVAEILIWYFKLLLDDTHTQVMSGERNLLFLIIDSATFVTILGLLLEAGGGKLPGAIADALSAFTLNGRPPGYQGEWASAVAVLGALGGVAMLGAGLALLIEIIGKRVTPGPGRYGKS